MRLLEALRNSVQRIEADLNDSRLIDHRGDRGEFREQVIANFLRPFLPTCYGLRSGAVFAADGSGSRQMDVVLYDAVFSNVLFSDSANSLFPAEAVFGAIEVKSDLSSATLDESIENIRSLKTLQRAPSDMCDILPFRRLGMGAGLTFSPEQRNPYLGICFAFDGLVGETVEGALNGRITSRPTDDELLPNFVFNYRREYFVFRAALQPNVGYSPVPIGAHFDRFCLLHLGTDTLPLFFLTVNVLLNNIILRAPDLEAYWRLVWSDAVARSSAGPTA